MGTDVTEAVKKLPSPCDIKVHIVMCTEFIKLVDRVDKIVPEIEAAKPRCLSGIDSLCSIVSSIDKAKSLIQDCCESSKLYLAFTGSKVLSSCTKSKNLLEQSLSQIQNMVPVMLASKICHIVRELRAAKFSLNPSEEEAGKAVRSLFAGYQTGNCSEQDSGRKWIQIAAQKLQIHPQKLFNLNEDPSKSLYNLMKETRNTRIFFYCFYTCLKSMKNQLHLDV